MKKIKEWFIDVPWGKVALVSWGNPSGDPVLLIHGRQDSAATFIPLLEHLPDTLYYVGVDLPGHGWSDPMPTGVMLTRLHFVAAVDYAVKHLNWDQFIFIAHSMGCEQGLFYNVFFPNKIKQFIFLDPIPSLQRLLMADPEQFYKQYYEEYYLNYESYNKDNRVYSRRQALDAVMKARGLNEEQAEMVLSRNLWSLGEDRYRLSWDRRLKIPAPPHLPPSYYFKLFSQNCPPTLIVSASSYKTPVLSGSRQLAEDLVRKLSESCEWSLVTVEGGHDVHITSVAAGECVRGFIESNRRAKL